MSKIYHLVTKLSSRDVPSSVGKPREDAIDYDKGKRNFLLRGFTYLKKYSFSSSGTEYNSTRHEAELVLTKVNIMSYNA